MNEFSKFIGCTKIVCIKSWYRFDAGKIYNCTFENSYFELEIAKNRNISYRDGVSNIVLDKDIKDFILNSFITLSEHRKLIINDLID